MSLVVVCKNGHRLRAPDRKAGTTGRCPACGVEVQIPKLNAAPTESSILRILGVGEELRRNMQEYDEQEAAKKAEADANSQEEQTPGNFFPDPLDGIGEPAPLKVHDKKVCPQCDWEIDAGFKICPHCRYYFMK
ncbi:MAG: hypothetical protein IJU03_01190 [Thermoguttaceae bacterium]|nr:hypothetical protein [Thermoguttaceae bacterium]